MSFSPFLTTAFNQKRPQDYTYLTPIYNDATDPDTGELTNPGEILYYKENYSGNKDSLGILYIYGTINTCHARYSTSTDY